MLEAIRTRPEVGVGDHHQSHQALEEAVADGCCLCARFQRSYQRELQTSNWVPSDGYAVSGMRYHYYTLHKLHEDPSMRLIFTFYGLGSRYDETWQLVPMREDNIYKKDLSKANYRYNSSTGSEESLALANLWLSTCIRKHTQCDRPRSSSLRDWTPTRLLYVGSGSDDIRLCEGQKIPIGVKYITLSHCWGKDLRRKTLTQHNIVAWREGIPDSELMHTFRDAVKVTRTLGVQYLWIDSLCIIQDSEDDWLHESSLMCRVYKFSYCTIAATAATDDGSGCFSDREQLDLPIEFDFSDFASRSPLQSVTKKPAESLGVTILTGVYEIHRSTFWFDDIGSSPLFARAWVLQERLLSPRLLHFAKDQLYWECSELHACESYPLGSPTDEYISLGHDATSLFEVQRESSEQLTSPHSAWRLMLRKLLRRRSRRSKTLDLSDQREKILKAWRWIVQTYTNSRLTQERDKLIAISAVAREIKPMMQCRYLAGLWEKDLVKQLCWFTHKGSASVESSRPTTYRAPSWSWASVEGACILPYFVNWLDPSEPMIEILSAHIELASEDETGPVKGGYLDVLGRLFHMDPREGAWQGEEQEPLHIEGVPTGLYLFKDVPQRKIDGQLYCMILLSSHGDDYAYIGGLALQQLGSSNVYRRVGYVSGIVYYDVKQEDPLVGLLGDWKTTEDGRVTFVSNDSERTTIRIV